MQRHALRYKICYASYEGCYAAVGYQLLTFTASSQQHHSTALSLSLSQNAENLSAIR